MCFFKAVVIKALVSFAWAASSLLFAAHCLATGFIVQDTQELRWQKRLLFVSVDTDNQQRLLNAWQSEHQEALEERKLLILRHEVDELWRVIDLRHSSVYANQSVANSICINCFVLVGLDGGIKHRKSLDADNLDKLFDIIDAMPMRRSELKRKAIIPKLPQDTRLQRENKRI